MIISALRVRLLRKTGSWDGELDSLKRFKDDVKEVRGTSNAACPAWQ